MGIESFLKSSGVFLLNKEVGPPYFLELSKSDFDTFTFEILGTIKPLTTWRVGGLFIHLYSEGLIFCVLDSSKRTCDY